MRDFVGPGLLFHWEKSAREKNQTEPESDFNFRAISVEGWNELPLSDLIPNPFYRSSLDDITHYATT